MKGVIAKGHLVIYEKKKKKNSLCWYGKVLKRCQKTFINDKKIVENILKSLKNVESKSTKMSWRGFYFR